MRAAVKTFLLFFAIQFLNYGVVAWNFRAVAQARYVHIGFSDMAAAAISFTLIQKVSKTESRIALAGYIAGGTVGSLAATFFTRLIFGQ